MNAILFTFFCFVAQAMAANKYTTTFQRANSMIDGSIQMTYTADPNTVNINANLDLTNVDTKQFCNETVTAYAWHVHVRWNDELGTSGALATCSPGNTGGHYDPSPNPACGPATDNKECTQEQKQNYQCSKDKSKCELGDLSGKVGNFNVVNNKISLQGVETRFPAYNDKANWSIVLHAVCGAARPRVYCAKMVPSKEHGCFRKKRKL